MQIYEVRGFDIREREVDEKFFVIKYVLNSNETNFIEFKTLDNLDALAYIDFTNNLVVVTE